MTQEKKVRTPRNHPLGYVYGEPARVGDAPKIGLLGTVFYPSGVKGFYHLGSDEEKIGVLPIRHDAHFTMAGDKPDEWLNGRIAFSAKDAREIPLAFGKEYKGSMRFDSSLANQNTEIELETGQWVPVIRVAADLPPQIPPPPPIVDGPQIDPGGGDGSGGAGSGPGGSSGGGPGGGGGGGGPGNPQERQSRGGGDKPQGPKHPKVKGKKPQPIGRQPKNVPCPHKTDDPPGKKGPIKVKGGGSGGNVSVGEGPIVKPPKAGEFWDPFGIGSGIPDKVKRRFVGGTIGDGGRAGDVLQSQANDSSGWTSVSRAKGAIVYGAEFDSRGALTGGYAIPSATEGEDGSTVGTQNVANTMTPFFGSKDGPSTVEGQLHALTYGLRAQQAITMAAFGGPNSLESNLGLAYKSGNGKTHIPSISVDNVVVPRDGETVVVDKPSMEFTSTVDTSTGGSVQIDRTVPIVQFGRDTPNVGDDRPLIHLGGNATGPDEPPLIHGGTLTNGEDHAMGIDGAGRMWTPQLQALITPECGTDEPLMIGTRADPGAYVTVAYGGDLTSEISTTSNGPTTNNDTTDMNGVATANALMVHNGDVQTNETVYMTAARSGGSSEFGGIYMGAYPTGGDPNYFNDGFRLSFKTGTSGDFSVDHYTAAPGSITESLFKVQTGSGVRFMTCFDDRLVSVPQTSLAGQVFVANGTGTPHYGSFTSFDVSAIRWAGLSTNGILVSSAASGVGVVSTIAAGSTGQVVMYGSPPGASDPTFLASIFGVKDDTTPTKIGRFVASSITAATTRSYTMPNQDGVMAAVASLAAEDVVVGASSSTWRRIGVGSNGDVLTVTAGTVGWAAPSGGSAHNLLSATHTDTLADTVVRGDLIVGNATPKWSRLAIAGSSGKALMSDGTDATWTTIPTQTSALLSATHTDTTAAAVVRGDLIAGIGATPKWERVALGSSGTFLKAGATEPGWSALAASDITSGTLAVARGGTNLGSYTTGDLLVATSSGVLAGLAAGATAGHVLTSNGAGVAPTYQAAGAGSFGTIADAATNTVSTYGTLIHTTSGAAATGFGGRLLMQLEDAAGNTQDAGSIEIYWTDATDPSEDSAFLVYTFVGGNKKNALYVDEADFFVLKPDGVNPALGVSRTLGAVTAGEWLATTIATARGGTGMTGFTAAGRLLVSTSASALSALAAGTDTHVLTMVSGAPAWAAPATQTSALLSATHTDTLADSVVRGDVLIGNSTPKWARKALGTSGYCLQSDGTDVVYGAVTKVQESAGPTVLTLGAIADGQAVVRSGTTLVGSSASSEAAANKVLRALAFA